MWWKYATKKAQGDYFQALDCFEKYAQQQDSYINSILAQSLYKAEGEYYSKLKDASEKAAIMVKTANDEYKKTIDEVNKIGSDINSFVGDYIKKLESQIESMKAISKVPVSPLNLDDFQISDVAKKFIEDDNVDGTLSVFSDVEVDNKEVKHKKKSKYNNLQFGARFKQF